jgi:hypothetical protein
VDRSALGLSDTSSVTLRLSGRLRRSIIRSASSRENTAPLMADEVRLAEEREGALRRLDLRASGRAEGGGAGVRAPFKRSSLEPPNRRARGDASSSGAARSCSNRLRRSSLDQTAHSFSGVHLQEHSAQPEHLDVVTLFLLRDAALRTDGLHVRAQRRG